MKTVGEIIKDKRLELGVSFQEIEKQIKISQRYLKAIEENRFDQISSLTTAKGFIRNYAICLGLSPDTLLAIFRRDYGDNQTIAILPKLSLQSENNRRSWWTPKSTLLLVIGILVLLIGGYLGGQYYRLMTGPKLVLISPLDGQVVTDKVVIEGDTVIDATIKIQGILTAVDEQGHFKQEIIMPRGDTILTVEATDRNNKNQIKKVRIKVE